jgi:hypothetical protein
MSVVCIYPGLWWGSYRQARSEEWLQEHGIERVITCAIDAQDLGGKMENLGIDWYWEGGLPFLEESLGNGIPTLIHCRGRPIRSGRFISYFWEKWLGGSSENIYQWLQICFPEVYS